MSALALEFDVGEAPGDGISITGTPAALRMLRDTIETALEDGIARVPTTDGEEIVVRRSDHVGGCNGTR